MLRRLLILSVIILAFAACDNTADDGVLPTVAVLPTLPPSATPTETLTPTITPTPTDTPTPTATLTPTATPTNTLTFTPTLTHTPTLTPTPSRTIPPTATSTHTLTFTPTTTPSLTPTNTPIASPTPDRPSIQIFQANTDNANAGTPIRLRWEAIGSSARLERLDANGTIAETLTVNPAGSVDRILPSGSATVIYRLVVSLGTLETSQTVTVRVTNFCTTPWFFGRPTVELGCPLAAPQTATGSYQQFERGFMFRIQLPNGDRVCGIQTSDSRYSCFPFQPYGGTPGVTPPQGLQPPGVDFQQVFYSTLSLSGPWYSNNSIGWGVGAFTQQSFTYQRDDQNRIYIQIQGSNYRFDANLGNGVYTLITGVTP